MDSKLLPAIGTIFPVKSEKGQSLIEVIVAATVGILVVTALTFATIFSLRNANFAKNSEQATKLAQEGIERLRTGRDRNAKIINLVSSDCSNVSSWNGDATGNPIWDCKIYAICGSGLNCYFRFSSVSSNNINFLTSSADFPSSAENIDPMFKRAIIIADDVASYFSQKTVTVIVRWSDFAGAHESKLSTILGKL